MKPDSRKKILVALSGGVDSSTAAALLKEQNFEVAAAIMIFQGVAEDAIEHAHHTARHLDIPFHLFDFTKQYKDIIVDNFINEYKSGRTPNPCVLCNKHIKFDLFLKMAGDMGMDNIATGHYAGLEKQNGRYLLKRGIDRNEQSYFLYRLDQRQLAQIILPLAKYTKEEIRKLAKRFQLPTADRKKSQDVCFIPDGDYVTYLKNVLHPIPGPILDKNGTVIGEHKGILFYTYGQRQGIGISHKEPYYVIKIDSAKNAIVVGTKRDVYKNQALVADLNYIAFDDLKARIEVMAKSRYASALARAVVEPLGSCGRAKVIFKKSQWALTPGQSVVFYQDDIVIGGGIISEILD